jgi:hypothetical protein
VVGEKRPDQRQFKPQSAVDELSTGGHLCRERWLWERHFPLEADQFIHEKHPFMIIVVIQVEPPYPVDESPREFAKEVSIVPCCMYEKNACKRHAKTRYLERMLPE